MRISAFAACGVLFFLVDPVLAGGVSPYLPVNLDPLVERQIERVLILADKAVLTRPIAAAAVLEALPKACQSDPVLCQEVRRSLTRYMRSWGVTEASIEGATATGSEKTIPNRYALTTASDWAVAAQGFWQPSGRVLVSLGGVAYEGDIVPQGSLISVGYDRAQLDLGYRARWLSPFSDSAMLSSTHAATMPSVTLSNYVPLTRWAFHYELFGARMSESDQIAFEGTAHRGRPHLAGIHLSMEPAHGWSIGVNRLLQYGGDSRDSSFSGLVHAFFNPSHYDNTSPQLTSDQQFGNQLASITSQFLFPGKVPFSLYFEYAGEDTSNGKNFLLGNSALSAGIRFPRLGRRFEFTYEISEWQNGWYVNGVYGDGLTNEDHIIGHWGGDERVFNDAVGARTQMAKLGWDTPFGGTLEVRYRTITNQSYGAFTYQHGYDGTLSYSYPLRSFTVGGEVFAGRDVFGESFSRAGAFVRYNPDNRVAGSFYDPDPVGAVDPSAELFVDGGASLSDVRIDLDGVTPPTRTSAQVAPHLGLGARRAVSDRSDLGARLEVDDIDGHTLLSVRAIDYRYRFANPLAFSVFIGASRYSLATPAYGLYYGAGLQWLNLLPGWDFGLDARYAKKVARDHLLASDPASAQPDSFYDIRSVTFDLTRRF